MMHVPPSLLKTEHASLPRHQKSWARERESRALVAIRASTLDGAPRSRGRPAAAEAGVQGPRAAHSPCQSVSRSTGSQCRSDTAKCDAHSWIPTHVFRGSVARGGAGEGRGGEGRGGEGRDVRGPWVGWLAGCGASGRVHPVNQLGVQAGAAEATTECPLARSTLSASQRRPIDRPHSLTWPFRLNHRGANRSCARTCTHTRCSTAQPMPFRRPADRPHRAGAAQAHHRLVARVQSPTPALDPSAHPPRAPVRPRLASRPPTHSGTIAHEGSQFGLAADCRRATTGAPSRAAAVVGCGGGLLRVAPLHSGSVLPPCSWQARLLHYFAVDGGADADPSWCAPRALSHFHAHSSSRASASATPARIGARMDAMRVIRRPAIAEAQHSPLQASTGRRVSRRRRCGWHNDHGSLTGLTSAMYFDSSGNVRCR
jgi:hypothetical protein